MTQQLSPSFSVAFPMKTHRQAWIGVVLFFLVLSGIYLFAASSFFPAIAPSFEIERIRKTGKIRMITLKGESSYFTVEDEPQGFEYEMAEVFAESLGVKLQVKTYSSWKEMVDALYKKEGDFIAANLMITPERKAVVDFSDEYLLIQQQLVVRPNHPPIQSFQDLEGKTIYVQKGSSAESWLKELQGEGYLFSICTDPPSQTETLVEQVATGKIDITVSNNLGAEDVEKYCPELISTGVVSGSHPIAWAVKKGASDLLSEMNQFLQSWEALQQITQTYTKYGSFQTEKQFDYVDITAYKKRIKIHLPRYQHLIQNAAAKYGFDWRLITAIIYQESQFNPMASHYKGAASGLMQLTQTTAIKLGVTDFYNPAQNIEAGVKYLYKLEKLFPNTTPADRVKFALAAYNIGIAHVQDAQKLAEQQGLDPNEWEDVEKTLPLLQNPRYYPKLRYGYGNGEATVFYVNKIYVYYKILQYLKV